jgi:hypothetical protein
MAFNFFVVKEMVEMKTGWKILLGIAGAVVLVVVGLGTGWLLWGRRLWMPGMMWGSGDCGGWNSPTWQGSRSRGYGPGMMGGGRGPGMMYNNQGWDDDCSMVEGYTVPTLDQISIEDAQKAVERYTADWDEGLEIAEMMEFEENFYAIVQEHDTGMGAMELLVDKTTGVVGPEMGPNMMWNARYGMHRRGGMMGVSGETNSISEDRAIEIAQTWLDKNKPGVNAEEHADPFYGYYTIHTMRDGEIEGMLSVHGATGQVWYHTWHGDFVQMVEYHDEHG